MKEFFLIGLGGAAGSIIRHLCQRLNTPAFPYGTFLVNGTGCLLIGIFWGLLSKNNLTPPAKLLLMTGFCGGFTTFSAFTYESLLLMQQNRWGYFLFYVLGSVGIGLTATFAGYKLSLIFSK